MFKKLGLISLAAAAITAMGVVACGDNTNTGTCTTDLDCTGEGEICHPDAQVCVKTCTSGSDCPSEAKTCGAISATDSRTVCQCATDQLCQTGPLGSTAVCSTSFKVCCDSSNTSCVGGETDGGVPDGGMGATCDWSTEDTACASGQVCNINAGSCEAPTSCTGAGQATVCSYGSSCKSGNCAPVPRPDAANCSPFSHNNITWNPTSDMGPVIYSVQNVTDVSADCSSGTAQTVQLMAYSPTAFPTDKNQLNGFNYINQSGSATSIPTLLKPSKYMGGGTNNITATFTLCNSNTSGAFSAGFEFANGNQFCFLVE